MLSSFAIYGTGEGGGGGGGDGAIPWWGEGARAGAGVAFPWDGASGGSRGGVGLVAGGVGRGWRGCGGVSLRSGATGVWSPALRWGGGRESCWWWAGWRRQGFGAGQGGGRLVTMRRRAAVPPLAAGGCGADGRGWSRWRRSGAWRRGRGVWSVAPTGRGGFTRSAGAAVGGPEGWQFWTGVPHWGRLSKVLCAGGGTAAGRGTASTGMLRVWGDPLVGCGGGDEGRGAGVGRWPSWWWEVGGGAGRGVSRFTLGQRARGRLVGWRRRPATVAVGRWGGDGGSPVRLRHGRRCRGAGALERRVVPGGRDQHHRA